MMNDSDTPSDESSSLTANALKAMAHPLRWKIICALGDKELSVGEIVDIVGASQSNVSQHLEILRNKNIVVSHREANKVFHQIRNDQLLTLVGTMRNVLCPANLED